MERIGKRHIGENGVTAVAFKRCVICSGHGPPEDNLVAISCQGDGKRCREPAPITVIEALRWFIRHPDVLQYLRQPAANGSEQRIEVNRRKVQLRECTAGYHAGDALTGMREQNVRAYAPRQWPSGCFDTRDGENTALLNFTGTRFLRPGGRYGNAVPLRKRHLPVERCRIQIRFNLAANLSGKRAARSALRKNILV